MKLTFGSRLYCYWYNIDKDGEWGITNKWKGIPNVDPFK